MSQSTQFTFEQAFAELEQVVQQLDSGNLTLEESLALFERGTVLSQLCERRLDQAEQKVQLLGGLESGQPTLTPFPLEDKH